MGMLGARLVAWSGSNQAQQMQAPRVWFPAPPPRPGSAHAKMPTRPGSVGTWKSAVSLEPGSSGASASAWPCAWASVQTQEITFVLDVKATKQHPNRACMHAYENQTSHSRTWRAWPERACPRHASQAVAIRKPNAPIQRGSEAAGSR
jgi:hypothetical protein